MEEGTLVGGIGVAEAGTLLGGMGVAEAETLVGGIGVTVGEMEVEMGPGVGAGTVNCAWHTRPAVTFTQGTLGMTSC